MPTGIAVRGGNAVQHIQCLLIVPVANIIVGGLHFRRFLAAVSAPGTARAAKSEPKRVKPKSEGVLILLLAIAVSTGVLAVAPTACTGTALGTATPGTHSHDFAVCGLHFFEFVLTGRIVRVQVGMILLAFLTVGLLDGFLIGPL